MSDTAIRAAHLASERVKPSQQPSIFDVLSQESLMSSLKPAVGHLIKYLAASNPGRFAGIYRCYDELYALFDLVIQNHSLRTYGASFSENFYGMKRIVNATGRAPVDGWNRLRSIIILVLLPYVREKLDKLYDRLKMKLQSRQRAVESMYDRLCHLFITVYPWIKSALDFWTLVLQFSYLLSKSDVHSPMLRFAGVHLETLTAEDYARFGKDVSGQQSSNIGARIWRMLIAIPTGLSRFLGYGMFFLQFLDYWYNSEQAQTANVDMRTIPAAPHRMLREDFVLSLETSKCPLCRNDRRNDTVLSVSGFVFCYSCIAPYVQRERKCPVSGLPAAPEQLIRIFTQVPRTGAD